MSNKTANKKTNGKKTQSKSNLPLILIAAVLVCAAAAAVVLKGGFGSSSGNSAGTASDGPQMISDGSYLTISTADITEDVTFYPIEVDGTDMEVIAVKASDGSIRTAFNTCQSCYTSGRGYYKQEEGQLVCQNCGFHFTPDQVEVQSGGCNPWPIFAENKTVTDDEIKIPYDFLKESSNIFSKWKI